MTIAHEITLPREGMMATVRNRRGLITSVEPFDAKPEGRLHLVRVEYSDGDGVPFDTVVWERERSPRVLEASELPRVDADPPMRGDDYDALVRASRWSALTPFLAPDGSGALTSPPIAAPFFGAVQVEDFQLVPLLKALQMPRVSLLLADDVGLGKTVEAGLILSELLLRRRVRRVLVLTPASLRKQWQQEMRDKFSLGFDTVDRDETHGLQKRLGLDANPWRTYPRIIASYYYLRQPDVLEQFRAACKQPDGAYQLPWDLLIVDEAHNLMPSSFGDDSDLSKMLRTISPWFEHKLFLTATPHNGHTRSFSGLLETLDPVRFTQKSELTDNERRRIDDVLVRRLKSEINTLDDDRKRPRRFAERSLEPLPLFFGRKEGALSSAFSAFRSAVRSAVARAQSGDRMAGSFAVEVLGKRLLSSPSTFAESWFRFRAGNEPGDEVEAGEVRAAARATEEDTDDDRERQGREQHAAGVVGAWLRPFLTLLEAPIAAIDAALSALGLRALADGEAPAPTDDARFERVCALIDKRLRDGKSWRGDERLIVFTEYKTTLDHLERRLRDRYRDDGVAIRLLFGGMDGLERDDVKAAFNDDRDPVRVLVATDAAAEGLNLQQTARLVLHYDIPWNPSRLEQRNGRLDRHGQARDVSVFHFTSDDDADLKFLGAVVDKVHAIRDDLGSLGELFDAAFQRRFGDLAEPEQVALELEAAVKERKKRSELSSGIRETAAEDQSARVAALARELDLRPDTLRETLDVALGIGGGRPRLEGPDARGRMKLRQPIPAAWNDVINDSLRLEKSEALPSLVFDAAAFIETVGGRPVFRPSPDAVLLHLGHPMFREALAAFARLRFPGRVDRVRPSRWTVRQGDVPDGADALVLLTVEELALNELREPFHHWVRTLRFPVRNGALGDVAAHVAPADEIGEAASDRAEAAVEIWHDVRAAMVAARKKHAEALSHALRSTLVHAGKAARHDEAARYKDRLNEVRAAMRETTLAKLEKERDKLVAQRQQELLFADLSRDLATKIENLDDELRRRRTHYEELLKQLEHDQARVLDQMLPKRFALSREAQVFPLTIEIRLPRAGVGGAR